MSRLLWRECIRNRWILVIGFAGILLPYLVAALVISPTDPEAYFTYVIAYSHSYLCAWGAIAVLMGGAVTGGRAERPAELANCGPLSRWKVLCSKQFLPLGIFAIAVGVNLVLVDGWILPLEPVEMTAVVDMRVFVSVLLVAYGVGWLTTQFFASSFYASLTGFVTPFLFAGIVAAVLKASGGEMDTLNGWVSASNRDLGKIRPTEQHHRRGHQRPRHAFPPRQSQSL